MKKIYNLLLILSVFLFTGCYSSQEYSTNTTYNQTTHKESTIKYTNYVTIKYRDSKVDVAEFEPLGRSDSSLVRDAWYDQENKYMIIDLNGTKYHYCRFPLSTRNNLKQADSLGTYYKTYIKGNYDCRLGGVPIY